jgi:hypothetical protein
VRTHVVNRTVVRNQSSDDRAGHKEGAPAKTPATRCLLKMPVFHSAPVTAPTPAPTPAPIRLPLQEQPFRVLAVLLECPGEVVTRQQLQARLWPADTYVGFDEGLNTAIRKLRTAFGDSAANPRFTDKAFFWLQKAYEDREGQVITLLKLDPAYKHLRSDPRFLHCCRRWDYRNNSRAPARRECCYLYLLACQLPWRCSKTVIIGFAGSVAANCSIHTRKYSREPGSCRRHR